MREQRQYSGPQPWWPRAAPAAALGPKSTSWDPSHGVPLPAPGTSWASLLAGSTWLLILFIAFPPSGRIWLLLYRHREGLVWQRRPGCLTWKRAAAAPRRSPPWWQTERPAFPLPLFLIILAALSGWWRGTWGLLCGSGSQTFASLSLGWLPCPHPLAH